MKISQDKPGHTEQLQWEALVESTFDRPAPKAPVVTEKAEAQPKKTALRRKKWPWVVLAALILVIAAVCIVPSFLKDDEGAAFPDELLVCKEALDQWQELDSYKITGTFYRYGTSSTVGTQWNQQYWVSGEDWVMLNSAYKQVISSSILPPAGYMYRDGEFYLSYSDTNPVWIHMKRENSDLGIWPMTFSWDTCEFVYLGTIQESNATMIRFAVIDRSQEATSVSNVDFMILRGKLQTVTVIQTQPNGTIAKDIYMLSSSDADVIDEYIANQVIRDPSGVEIVIPDIGIDDIEPPNLPDD